MQVTSLHSDDVRRGRRWIGFYKCECACEMGGGLEFICVVLKVGGGG